MNPSDSTTKAIFFISTGRCGTQFFADRLASHYEDLAVVDHEPMDTEYETRRYFSAYHGCGDMELSSAIQKHVARIERILKKSSYIEVGWPVYGVLPALLQRFNGRVKVVHLYRHPIRVAASLSTHQVYSRGGWSDALGLSPTDYGVIQSHLAGDAWSRMSEFEKCLFWWTEINHFALRLEKSFPEIPMLRLKFEDAFGVSGKQELERLLDFLELPIRREFFEILDSKTDRFSTKTTHAIRITDIRKYPMAQQLMGEFGYKLEKGMSKEIMDRYQRSGSKSKGVKALLRLGISKAREILNDLTRRRDD